MTAALLSAAVLLAHWLIVIGLSIRVIMRRPPVGVALAWLAVVFSVPFVGAVIYLLFGEKRMTSRRLRNLGRSAVSLQAWQESFKLRFPAGTNTLDEQIAPLFHQAEAAVGMPPVPAGSFELLPDYNAIFDRLASDLRAALVSVDLSFYIWHEGGRVSEIVAALIDAARRGVRCRVLVDAVGSRPFLNSRSYGQLREAGVALGVALPGGLLRALVARMDLRNHRKLAIIDGRIGYTGSQNLVDPRYFKSDSGVGPWIDAMVRIVGPTAEALAAVFELDWSVESGHPFAAPAPADTSTTASVTQIQVVPSGPDLHPQAIHQVLLTALYAARRELVITTPYFVPDDSLLAALVSAARRGVDVVLVVPAHNDSLLVRHASVAHFDDLLAAGVRIALFEGGLLHTKSMTIDRQWSLFGSVNFDMRSLWLNFEISLLIAGKDFANQLGALQSDYVQRSTWVDLKRWRRRPFRRRLAANACRLLSPLL